MFTLMLVNSYTNIFQFIPFYMEMFYVVIIFYVIFNQCYSFSNITDLFKHSSLRNIINFVKNINLYDKL